LSRIISDAHGGIITNSPCTGSVLTIDGKIVGRGTTGGSRMAVPSCMRKWTVSRTPDDSGSRLRRAVLYSALSPCDMCSGTALLYGIPKIVAGETQTFRGPEDYLRARLVELVILNDVELHPAHDRSINARPDLWHVDIGT